MSYPVKYIQDKGHFTEHETMRQSLHDIDKGQLFDALVVLSPLAKWKAENDVTTNFNGTLSLAEDPWIAFPPGKNWETANPELCGYGATELLACYRLANIFKMIWFQNGKVPK